MNVYFITKQINDLNGDAILKDISISQLKRMAEILVIDDNAFTYLDSLQKHEFNIEYRSDIQSLKDVEAYDVILCDVRGVGKFLTSKYEGAYLVKQIKEKYPNKIVISYTANDFDPVFQQYLSYADAIVPKGCSLEDWSPLLAEKLKESADPVKQWEKTRIALLNAGVKTIEVAKLESKYVKAIQEGSFETIKKLYSGKKSVESNIMLSLLSSTIAKIFKP